MESKKQAPVIMPRPIFPIFSDSFCFSVFRGQWYVFREHWAVGCFWRALETNGLKYLHSDNHVFGGFQDFYTLVPHNASSVQIRGFFWSIFS